jgi:hypothetical protein
VYDEFAGLGFDTGAGLTEDGKDLLNLLRRTSARGSSL